MKTLYHKLVLIFLIAPMLVSAESLLIPVSLEHAVNRSQRQQGLQGRESLPEDGGMLFHMPGPSRTRFWMYGCLIDLSIAFLDAKGKVIEIHEMQAFPEVSDPAFFSKRAVGPQRPADYALEMRAGWFAEKGIRPGDVLHWTYPGTAGYFVRQPASD